MLRDDKGGSPVHILADAEGWNAPVTLETGDPQKLLDYLSGRAGEERVWAVAFGRVFSRHDKVYITVLADVKIADALKSGRVKRLHKDLGQFSAVEKYIVRVMPNQAGG